MHDVPASSVATIPGGTYKGGQERELRSAKAKETGTVRCR